MIDTSGTPYHLAKEEVRVEFRYESYISVPTGCSIRVQILYHLATRPADILVFTFEIYRHPQHRLSLNYFSI